MAIFALASVLTWGAPESFAAPAFYSTTDASHWQVSTSMGGADGQLASFSTASFQTAVARTDAPGWIANIASGSNSCCVGNWTFFVFRQTFDLTGYNPATANLQFQWAADDSGEGFAARGSWVPKFSLNGGSMVPWGTGATYSFGPTVDIHSGFVSGINTIDFYVEGNGVTDGLSLRTVGFNVTAVPEPETCAMLLAGLGLLGFVARRGKKQTT